MYRTKRWYTARYVGLGGANRFDYSNQQREIRLVSGPTKETITWEAERAKYRFESFRLERGGSVDIKDGIQFIAKNLTVGGGDDGNDVSTMYIHHTGVKLQVDTLRVDASGLISGKGLSHETRGNPDAYHENYGGTHGGPGGGPSGRKRDPGTTGGYGDFVWPITAGSRGGRGHSSVAEGAAGGSAIYIEASSEVRMEGAIDMDGADGTSVCGACGGAAGGSVLISSPVLLGNGTVSARGGMGGPGRSNKRGCGGRRWSRGVSRSGPDRLHRRSVLPRRIG